MTRCNKHLLTPRSTHGDPCKACAALSKRNTDHAAPVR